MTVNELLREGSRRLKEANIEAPAFEAGVLLCNVLECDKTFLYTRGDSAVEDNKAAEYLKWLAKRCEGMPLQYLTGHQEFMSIDFVVTKDVLIPRHDTEILVEAVLNYMDTIANTNTLSEKRELNVLDIGTGSGCIAVSIASFNKASKVTAVDISKKALEIASQNAKRAGVQERIHFVQSNLFEGLESDIQFDVIVSNPPYIETAVVDTLLPQVKDFEPLNALDGGKDGLDFYRNITKESIEYLKSGGLLAFEVGYNQANAVAEIMSRRFENIQFHKDLSGINRVVAGNLCKL